MKLKKLTLIAVFGLILGTIAPASAGPGVNGFGNATTTVNFNLSLACDNNGSEVGFGANGTNAGTTNLEAKLAFANPSVIWDVVSKSFVKKSGNGTFVKVNDGTDLTTIPLVLAGGSVKKSNSHRAMGNPYVYYFVEESDSTPGAWQKLGRCNSPNDQLKSVNFKNQNFSLTGNVEGHGNGPCMTNARGSAMGFGSKFTPGNANMMATAKLVYSNKNIGEEELKGFENVGDGTQNSLTPGTYVSRKNLTVEITDAEINASFPAKDRNATGIGGNPNVWLKAGDSEFFNMGRCNTLTN